MAIQGTQVPKYTNTHCFCIYLIFPFFILKKKNKIKTKQPNKNKQTTWNHERNMQMHESMIPKADKKSSKENANLDRKN